MKSLITRGSAAVSMFFIALYAHADSVLPANFEADLGQVKTDLKTMIGALVGVLVIILAWRYFKKGAN